MPSSNETHSKHHAVLGLPPALTITICGGGNSAHVAAGYLGSKPGLCVNVLTRRPERWSNEVTVLTDSSSWYGKGTLVGRINCVTRDPQQVIPKSDIVLVSAPSNAYRDILRTIAPHVKQGVLLGTIFGQGAFDWAVCDTFNGQMSKLQAIFGLFNIPWICTFREDEGVGRIVGPKKFLLVTSFPVDKANFIAHTVALLFDIPTKTVPNFLTLTLTPSNQIIHPARYYAMFKNWDGEATFSKDEIQWGLYLEFDDEAADWLERLDEELQSIKRGLVKRYPTLDLTNVVPIKQRIIAQYGDDVKDPSTMKSTFRSNRGYAGTRTPMERTPDGRFIPAVKSRLFWEDIPYGLVILKSIAQMLNQATPAIDHMIRWHQKFMGLQFLLPDGRLNQAVISQTGAPEAYNMYTLDDLVAASLPTGLLPCRAKL